MYFLNLQRLYSKFLHNEIIGLFVIISISCICDSNLNISFFPTKVRFLVTIFSLNKTKIKYPHKYCQNDQMIENLQQTILIAKSVMNFDIYKK